MRGEQGGAITLAVRKVALNVTIPMYAPVCTVAFSPGDWQGMFTGQKEYGELTSSLLHQSRCGMLLDGSLGRRCSI